MIDLKVVTGYVPIPGHPRSAAEYGALGEKLTGISAPIKSFYTSLDACWMSRYLYGLPYKVKPCEGDNPEKNSLAYHIVQHQKAHWLQLEAADHKDVETFVWIDYGIFHQSGVTVSAINDFLRRIKRDDFAIPGCWDTDLVQVEDDNICWRFCGSVLVVPRRHVLALDVAMMKTVGFSMKHTHKLTWEVNTLARVEQNYPNLPIRWYKADHNVTQFTDYKAP